MSHKVWLILFMAMFLVACSQSEPEQMVTPAMEGAADSAGLPNPASVYCEEQGYELELREGEGGTRSTT